MTAKKKSFALGEDYYVPSTAWPPLIGGLGRIVFIDKARFHWRETTFQIEEHPGFAYVLGDVSGLQRKLAALFGTRRARLPSAAEREKAEAAHAALTQQRLAEEESRRIKAELEARRKTEAQIFSVINRGLLEVPVWSDQELAKNWAAVISVNPARPGGLDRYFFNRGNGPSKYIVPDGLEAGDIIEFGADRYSFGGYQRRERWYGVLISSTPMALCIQPAESVLTAFLLSDTIRAELARDTPKIRLDIG